jgi:anti-sigma factor RsiW
LVDHISKADLASYALGAVPAEADAEAEMKAHLADCSACRLQLREFRQAATDLVDPEPVDVEPVDVDLPALERVWERVRKRIHRP